MASIFPSALWRTLSPLASPPWPVLTLTCLQNLSHFLHSDSLVLFESVSVQCQTVLFYFSTTCSLNLKITLLSRPWAGGGGVVLPMLRVSALLESRPGGGWGRGNSCALVSCTPETFNRHFSSSQMTDLTECLSSL